MGFLGHYSFNLFFNTACSFLAGVIVIWLAIRVFRVGPGRWKLFLFSLPFLKIIWDLAYLGIPEHSVLHSGFDPLAAAPKMQTLTVGGGFSKYGPILNLATFEVTAADGKKYTLSMADYFFSLSSKLIGHRAPYYILAAAFGVSVFLVLRRLFLAIQFEEERKRTRAGGTSLKTLRCGGRDVDVYTSSHYQGSPFTGGIFKPYICFPLVSFNALSESERQAVLQHELGHVKQWDLAGTLFVKVMGDLFWFVPFYRVLSRKIDRLREILADDYAVREGARPADLASALLCLESSKMGGTKTVIYSAFFREKKLLKHRVEKLLGSEIEKSPRFGWDRPWVRIPIAAWTAGTVMLATLGGNHNVLSTPGIPPEFQALIRFIHHVVSLL